MKQDIYYVTLVKKNDDGSLVQEQDLQYFDVDFSITNERCKELCDELHLHAISFLKIGTADFLIDFDNPDSYRDEFIHYEVNENELQK